MQRHQIKGLCCPATKIERKQSSFCSRCWGSYFSWSLLQTGSEAARQQLVIPAETAQCGLLADWSLSFLISLNRRQDVLGVTRVSKRVRGYFSSLWSWLLLKQLPVFTFLCLQSCLALQALPVWVVQANSLWLFTEGHIYDSLSFAKATAVTI